jgi:hypothetical protein
MPRRRAILLPSPPMTTCASWTATKRKRRTLWQNAARNGLVAKAAAACLKQDRKTLKELGVPARNKKKGMWTHRVVILVENAEHAHALGEMLPEWEVLTTVPAEGPNDEEEQEGMPLTSGHIITWMHAERHVMHADYLVRATGWRGRMRLDRENSWLKRPERRLIVVDFDDNWDLQAGMDTEARVQEYEEQGLEVTYTNKNITET